MVFSDGNCCYARHQSKYTILSNSITVIYDMNKTHFPLILCITLYSLQCFYNYGNTPKTNNIYRAGSEYHITHYSVWPEIWNYKVTKTVTKKLLKILNHCNSAQDIRIIWLLREIESHKTVRKLKFWILNNFEFGRWRYRWRNQIKSNQRLII